MRDWLGGEVRRQSWRRPAGRWTALPPGYYEIERRQRGRTQRRPCGARGAAAAEPHVRGDDSFRAGMEYRHRAVDRARRHRHRPGRAVLGSRSSRSRGSTPARMATPGTWRRCGRRHRAAAGAQLCQPALRRRPDAVHSATGRAAFAAYGAELVRRTWRPGDGGRGLERDQRQLLQRTVPAGPRRYLRRLAGGQLRRAEGRPSAT